MLEQAKTYDDWAWLYNQTLGPRYVEHKIGPIARIVLPHVPAGGRILDLCCGTGQLAGRLAERGYAVTGFDGSADMLRHARQNAPTATFVQGDARAFAFDAPFHAILCTSASLNHMAALKDLRGVFTSANAALVPGGLFVFDVNHPAQMSRHWRGRPTEGELHADYAWLITPDYDPAAGRGTFTVDIYRRPQGARRLPLGGMIARVTQGKALRRSRLALLARYGSLCPDWERHSVANAVWGHDLDAMADLLGACGFEPELRSTGGGAIDDQHAAYFLCRRVADATTTSPEIATPAPRAMTPAAAR